MPIDPTTASKKLEEARQLVDGLSKDIQGFLTMAQMSVPLAESVLRRFSERTDQIKTLFNLNQGDTHGPSEPLHRHD